MALTLTTVTAQSKAKAVRQVHDVQIQGFTFKPAVLHVRPGDQIRWTNQDLAPHTATADDGSWDTGELAQGQSALILITEETYSFYFCAFHPHMVASLVIDKP